MSRISVVGSINVDLVVKTKKRPMKGETVFGEKFTLKPGGKGANQAVAISRLEGKVKMFGCVGDDIYSNMMLENLKTNNVNTKNIKKIKNISTGIASITVSENDNSIIVVKGANDYVDIEYIKSVEDEILKSDYILMQNEIPIDTIKYVVSLCLKNNIISIVNPAPAEKMDFKTLEMIDYLTPNEHEALKIIEGINEVDEILKKYPKKIIVTLGEKGVKYYDGKYIKNVPANRNINIVDTTGAGDTFSGAFVKAISEKMNIEESVKFAQVASGMAIEKFGAQEGMPTLKELESRMKIKK